MNEVLLSVWVLVYPIYYTETNTTVTSLMEYRSEEVCLLQKEKFGKGECVPHQLTLKINKQGGRKNVTSTIFDKRRV